MLKTFGLIAVCTICACGGEVTKRAPPAPSYASGGSRNSAIVVEHLAATGASAGLGGSRSVSATGGSPEVSSACAVVKATGSPPLIDDLDDGDGDLPLNDGRNGFWYADSDGTGEFIPPSVRTTNCDPTYRYLPTNGRACISGRGFRDWGAGIGLALRNGPNCTSCNYDVTALRGVSFTISATTPGSIRFLVITADTHEAKWGGTCTSNQCTDSYGVAVQVTAAPRAVQVAWSDLSQMGWGTTFPLNLHQVHNIEWLVRTDTALATNFQDLCIDNINFY